MKRMFFLLLVINAFAWPTASAAVSNEEFEELRQQLAAVSQRLEELAAENSELRRTQTQTATLVADVQKSISDGPATDGYVAPTSWSDRVKMDGDFRYRYEDIDVEGTSNRARNRIRARTNVRAT